MQKNRYAYLDLLKTLAIFFVCIYHFWHGKSEGIVGDYLYCALGTCVPLFFAVNGALLLNRQTFDAKRFYRKLLVMIVQYFIWNGITLIILGSHAERLQFTGRAHLLNTFLLLQPLEGIRTNHLWFIPTLCCVYVLYPFIRTVFQQDDVDSECVLAALIAVIFFLGFVLNDFENLKMTVPTLAKLNTGNLKQFYSFRNHTGTMLLYFVLGGFMHKYRKRTEKILPVSILIMLTGMALIYGTKYLMAIREIHYDVVFDSYSTIGGCLCTVGIFLLASKVEHCIAGCEVLVKILRIVGSNTLTIYYTHWILGYTLLPRLPLDYGFFWNLFTGLLLIALGTLIGEIMKRIPVVKYLVHVI